ncbi:MAG: GpE family phage tail protein [Myxococcales bacterium]|nr:GpE family phage tail protein [Myxococcales bacterium]
MFHWPPSELGELTAAQLRFWTERANEAVKRRR